MVESKFKNTDIGNIPEDWDLVNWNDVFDFKSTASYSRAEIKSSGNVGYIHYGDIHTKIKATLDVNKFVSGYISNKQLKTYTPIKKGDLIMADASEDLSGIGKSFEVIESPKKPVVSGLHTFLIREKKSGLLANGFKGYFHFNPLIKKQYDSLATGLKVYSLSKGSFQHIQIPLPPLTEQNEIAKVLRDTDTWINSLENLIEKKYQIGQGIMKRLLTPNKDWRVKKLGEISQIYTGNKNNQDKNEDGLFPFFVRSQKVERINTYSYEGEAILIPGEGNLGSIFHYVNGKFDFHQRVYKVSDFKGINGKYLYWYFRVYFGHHALQNSVKATVDSIRLPTIQEFEVSFPILKEQIRIANLLSEMDSEMENLEKKLAKTKQLKQAIMQQLLTGKIRLVEPKVEETQPVKKHNDHFNDAVLIGAMASCFASEQYPMTRFKYTKVSYLLKRYKEEKTTGYLKKAAGPYKPETRYGGAEKIAITNKYVATKKSVYKGKQYEGFVNSSNIQEAIDYFKKWYSEDALQWINRFKFETNDNLELWATVDMAIQDLKSEDKPINLEAVKEIIKNNKEWKDKLKRTIFSDDNIKNAIVRLETLYT